MRCLLTIALAACGDNQSVRDVTIDVDMTASGAAIPDDFLGVSYETSTLVTEPGYFDPSNVALLHIFDTLGIRSLRLGGNESDVGPMPTPAEVDHALAFANAASVHVIYTLRLATFDATVAASTAGDVLDHASALDCLAIGNEPNSYLSSYAAYASDVRAYRSAIQDARAVYCGPDTFGIDSEWVRSYAQDFVTPFVSFHEYFGGDGGSIDPASARDLLLSASLLDAYAADQEVVAALRFRLTESNSFYDGGAPGASNSFASALWGLDYLHWWASHGALGINFHTGDHVSGATTSYALFTTAGDAYVAHPLAYAAKAFDLGGHGNSIPLTFDAVADLTAYAVRRDQDVFVTIVNKSHDAAALDHVVAIRSAASVAEGWTLVASGLAATTDVTLGGASITSDGSWAGAPEHLDILGGVIEVAVPAASAVVVALH
jgi:hypothetical protein